jgi:hypothetical protein
MFNSQSKHTVTLPQTVYAELQRVSSDTGKTIESIVQRGIQLGMLESTVKNNGGQILVKSGKDATWIEIT